MTMRDKIDGVLIDPDENGFHLILSGEEREYNFLLDQHAALALTTAVAAELSPWIQEMRSAQPTRDPQSELRFRDHGGDGPEPYDQLDPKNSEYHDLLSEVYDNREGK